MSGDKTLVSACSKELAKLGWRTSYKNIPAAYLTGLLFGKRARARGTEKAILDIGLRRPSAGARVFAVLRGVNDAGLQVPYKERVLPSDERIKGDHITSYATKLLEEQLDYVRQFSQDLLKVLNSNELTNQFHLIRNAVLNAING